jgi:hypothetical protein
MEVIILKSGSKEMAIYTIIFFSVHEFSGAIARLLFFFEYAAVTIKIRKITSANPEQINSEKLFRILQVLKWIFFLIYLILTGVNSFSLYSIATGGYPTLLHIYALWAIMTLDIVLIGIFFYCIGTIWRHLKNKKAQVNYRSFLMKGVLGVASWAARLWCLIH